MILKDKIYFIDFGLSFVSKKLEDKAVDLHLFRQALESRHHRIWEKCFSEFSKAYGDKAVLKRLEIVEARGRNKHK
jgi:TP53 regulating kinase-like protein